MELTPETQTALGEFMPLEDDDLESVLREMGRAVREVVPQCVGLSLGLSAEDLTFTLVASGSEVAAIDATQYLDGGPCVAVSTDPEFLEVAMDDLLDEGRWQLFARASAAAGVASSLSLPIMRGNVVVGGVNLYASTPHAFTGHHDEIARRLGASAGAAVTNADLTFSSRRRAAEAPRILKDRNAVDTAVGLLAARSGVGLDEASRRLQEAAEQAGLAEADVARVLIRLHVS